MMIEKILFSTLGAGGGTDLVVPCPPAWAHGHGASKKGTKLCWTDTSGTEQLQHEPSPLIVAVFILSYFTLLLTSKRQSKFLLLVSFQFGSATQASIAV